MEKNVEVELKLLIKKNDLKKLLASDLIKSVLRSGSEKNLSLETIYYDTEDFVLKNNGIAYRVRNKGNGEYEATVKTAQKSSSGLSERVEINMPLKDSNAVLEGFKDLGLGFELTELAASGVSALFKTEIERTVYILDLPDAVIEMAVDRGKISRGKSVDKIDELELELLEGEKGALLNFAAKIAEQVPVFIERRSKFARGLALMNIETDTEKVKYKISPAENIKTEMFKCLQAHCNELLLAQNSVKTGLFNKAEAKCLLKELQYLRSYLEFSQAFVDGAFSCHVQRLDVLIAELGQVLNIRELQKMWQDIYALSSQVFEKNVLTDKLSEDEAVAVEKFTERIKKGELTGLVFAVIADFYNKAWVNEEYLLAESTVRCRLQEWYDTLAELEDDKEKLAVLLNIRLILKSMQGKNYAKAEARFKEKQKKFEQQKKSDLLQIVRYLGTGSSSRVLNRDIGILLGWLLAKKSV